MARDKFSDKIAHTLYQVSYFYKKFSDAGWRDKSRKVMQAQEDPGLADSLLIARPGHRAIFVEHKTGTGTSRERFAFENWNERQRLFCIACYYSSIPYWIFLVMGTAVGARDYPLQAFLLTGEMMFDIEALAAPRKSLSYVTAQKLLTPLPWVKGEDRWDIPLEHPFRQLLGDTDCGQPAYRHPARRRDGERHRPLQYPAAL